jgi:hypothetical protein
LHPVHTRLLLAAFFRKTEAFQNAAPTNQPFITVVLKSHNGILELQTPEFYKSARHVLSMKKERRHE